MESLFNPRACRLVAACDIIDTLDFPYGDHRLLVNDLWAFARPVHENAPNDFDCRQFFDVAFDAKDDLDVRRFGALEFDQDGRGWADGVRGEQRKTAASECGEIDGPGDAMEVYSWSHCLMA